MSMREPSRRFFDTPRGDASSVYSLPEAWFMILHITTKKRLSFALLVPNEETAEALVAAHRDELVTVGGLSG